MANIRKLIFLFFEVFFIFYLIFEMLFCKTKFTNFINSTRFFTQPIQQLIYREHGNPAEVFFLFFFKFYFEGFDFIQ